MARENSPPPDPWRYSGWTFPRRRTASPWPCRLTRPSRIVASSMVRFVGGHLNHLEPGGHGRFKGFEAFRFLQNGKQPHARPVHWLATWAAQYGSVRWPWGSAGESGIRRAS